jgi:putative holliday junction resolvase
VTDPNSEGDSRLVEPEALPSQGRLLGLDFGTKRVGLAISTPEQTIASPFETYARKSESRDAEFLVRVVREHRIVGIVVGLPMHTGGEEGIKAREARDFGQWVSSATELPVAFWDERFTTAVAQDLMRDAGVPRSKWKERVDKLAAQILLQSFLDSRRSTTG